MFPRSIPSRPPIPPIYYIPIFPKFPNGFYPIPVYILLGTYEAGY